VVVAKPGLDGHDRGAKIVETVIQEDADAVGISILSGAHMTLVPRIVELLRAQGADDVLVVVGGTIPADDAAALKEQGIAEVFGPGAPTAAIVEFLQGALATA
jgi:methylmalonyl-CoA mutase C-terminal domain/subunit